MAVILGADRDVAAFRPERFNSIAAAAAAHTEAVITCLEPGQVIPVYRPGIGIEEAAHPGTTIFVRAGEMRERRALARMVALHVESPPPREAKDAEVAVCLKQGEWR